MAVTVALTPVLQKAKTLSKHLKNNLIFYFFFDFGATNFLRLSIRLVPGNFDVNQGPLLFCKFAKMTLYNPNVDLVNDNVYTKFG